MVYLEEKFAAAWSQCGYSHYW